MDNRMDEPLPVERSVKPMAAPITSTPVLKGKDLVNLVKDLNKRDNNKDRRQKALKALKMVTKG